MQGLRIAVIGAGLIGRRHAELAARHGCLDAVIDTDDAAEAFAAGLAARRFADLDRYLAATGADGAIIATPNQLHADHALACIARGLPVLIEKPIADSTEGATAILDAATRAGVPVLVGHHRRHNPLIQAAKAAIEAGRLGRIAAVNAQFWLYKPDDYYDQSWRRSVGAGPVFINLIHDIDLLCHLCGDIVCVDARQSSAVRHFEVEDTAAIILRFGNGALGTVSVSDSVVAPWSWEFASGENPVYPKTDVPSYMIGGTHGALSIPDMRLWSQPKGRNWWHPIDSQRLSFDAEDPFARQFAHFCEVIAGRAEPLVPGIDGWRTLSVVEAIKRSANTGASQIPASVDPGQDI